jgi:hypothetical protein
MSYQNKYLKYKNKYLDLKKQFGGSLISTGVPVAQVARPPITLTTNCLALLQNGGIFKNRTTINDEKPISRSQMY